MIISYVLLSPAQLLACHALLIRTSTQAQVSAVHSVHTLLYVASEDKMHARFTSVTLLVERKNNSLIGESATWMEIIYVKCIWMIFHLLFNCRD